MGMGMATYSSILAWRIPWTEDPEMQWIMQETGGILPLQPYLLLQNEKKNLLCHTDSVSQPEVRGLALGVFRG